MRELSDRDVVEYDAVVFFAFGEVDGSEDNALKVLGFQRPAGFVLSFAMLDKVGDRYRSHCFHGGEKILLVGALLEFLELVVLLWVFGRVL